MMRCRQTHPSALLTELQLALNIEASDIKTLVAQSTV